MEKLEKLRACFAEYGIDGMLITNSYNRRYMTGFTGTAGVAVISKTEAVFITDFRYAEQAAKQIKGYEIVQHAGSIIEEVAKQAARLQIKKLGFEQDHLSYATFQAYEREAEVVLVPVSGLVEKLRLIKSDSEIKILKEAAEIADAAFNHILQFIRPGVREIEVAHELEFFMRKQGAISSSFDIIVASGYRSALPHGVATDKIIEKGEFVTLDFGAYYHGYCSDITRTVAVGEVSDELKKIYDIVLKAQLRGMEGIKPGMTGKEADALTRDYISEQGYGEHFGHSTGHGIGLEIHEGPTLSVRSDVRLEPGMVVTVEPGIYIAGLGGVRIEDDTVVTADGNDPLTRSPKELIIL
ncbi:Xaa-Pro peptidase family protein [Anoxybacillus rupiensis]|uniref:Xaa-Pro peptidase family protein n=1 Tax=Anoxybacteroides rupiense TaxID=311460 RepID=A0ABD5IRG7_9BACL|nr:MULTISPECIES: Xaa-Pro peptidase family protein [Anoxybacillus]MBB3906812.1 Xaa-Pro aminopeptidase [Anoxybacillus rupiensis]MBS2770077.1 aminopeptidase P family protein [Anoxybacillus rupiensis]MDE8562551.1 Xaa-Pro peptidase family protein [Anoxybacillus rupiensis]MED5050798.1 Xaa-Pro peptidase family protein [Anoxybacillus rupiensis]OQM44983.1 Xaa-Pro dipeptidase [Anoxybacillus sp. UARK-01]